MKKLLISLGVAASLLAGAGIAAGDPAPDAARFRNPVNGGADPTMTHYRGHYYVATTQGDGIRIWKARSVATLSRARPVKVWSDTHPSRNKEFWAPALRKIGARWYLYYTARGKRVDHRNYVLESKGSDPMGPYHFKGRLADARNDTWAIDGEPFWHNGQRYFAWSGQRGRKTNLLFVAKMKNPWTLSGRRVYLPARGACRDIREAPTPLYRGPRTFLTYSTCHTKDAGYQVWMLSIGRGKNPLNPRHWRQWNTPLLSSSRSAGVWSTGHNAFFTSPDGREVWIAYHAKKTAASTLKGRTTRIQRLEWNADGTPKRVHPAPLNANLPLPSGDPGP